MKKNITLYVVACGLAAGIAVVAGMALPALALSSGTSTGSGTTLSARITNIVNRADEEIVRRLNALNTLIFRVEAMTHISSADQANLIAAIQGQISAMNTLQSQIAADAQANNTTTLKTDVDSITTSYRIFVLVLPQGAIEAAADRVLDITGIMTDLGTKFSARISAAETAGNNVSAAESVMTDFSDKVSDAGAQANAAVSEVASLAPDNGNATIEASNTAALKDARSKILVAQQDLVAARADATAVIKALAGYKGFASASTTASASTSAQ